MNTSTYLHIDICLYVLLLSFKSVQPTKRKHRLTFNLQLCLISMYLYSKIVERDFSRTGIKSFMTYFNSHYINRYFDIFQDRRLIVKSCIRNSYQFYRLTNQAITTVEEIPVNYNKVLYEFCNKYNVVL